MRMHLLFILKHLSNVRHSIIQRILRGDRFASSATEHAFTNVYIRHNDFVSWDVYGMGMGCGCDESRPYCPLSDTACQPVSESSARVSYRLLVYAM